MARLLPLCLFTVACSASKGTLVVVTVDALDPLAGVAKLHGHAVAGAHTRDFDVTLTQPMFPPKHVFGLQVDPEYTGMLALHLDALAAAGATLASGDGTATLKPGTSVPLDIIFGAPAPFDGGPDQAVPDGGSSDGPPLMLDAAMPIDAAGLTPIAVTPSTPTMGVGRPLQFTAPVAVTWAVQGGAANGTIDAGGIYVAPQTPGSYTILATNPGGLGTATVTVRPLVMGAVGGLFGGPGMIDGVGSAAHFDNPRGAALDRKGFLYIADSNNHTVRRMNTLGNLVTTLAGTAKQSGYVDAPGAAARFNQPTRVAVDFNGVYVYVIDSNNSALREITVANGAVRTITGPNDLGGGAAFGSTDLYYPGVGNFIYTVGGSTINKVAIDTGGFTLVASTGFSGLRGITGHDPTGNGTIDLLYVSDGNSIKTVDPTNGTVTLIAGDAATPGTTDNTMGAMARFSQPGCMQLGESNQELYIVDTNNCTIRRMDTSFPYGVTTAAGTGAACLAIVDGIGAAARFILPVGIGFNFNGYTAYIVDQFFTIRKLTTSDRMVTSVAGAPWSAFNVDGTKSTGELDVPLGIGISGGEVFVATPGLKNPSHVIRRINLSTGDVGTLAGQAGTPGSAIGMGTAAQFNFPYDVAGDGAGNLYVADAKNNAIRKIVITTANVTNFAGDPTMPGGYVDLSGTAARFNSPVGLIVDGAYLYVVDAGNQLIRRVRLTDAAVDTLAGTLGMAGYKDDTGTAAQFNFTPAALLLPKVAADGKGTLYVADTANFVIRAVDLSSKAVTTLAGHAGAQALVDDVGDAARFLFPAGLAYDGLRMLYVSEGAVVRQVDTSTRAVTTLLGTPGQVGVRLGALPTTVNQAVGLAVTPLGDLLVSDWMENVVLIVQPQ